MRPNSSTNLLISVLLALVIAAAVAWAVAPVAIVEAWWLRLLVLGVLATVASPVLYWQLSKSGQSDTKAQQLFASLCDMEANDLNLDDAECECPLSLSHPWHSVYARLRDQMVEQRRRLIEAENCRARAEIRTQKVASERRQIAEILGNLQDPVLAIDQYDELLMANPSAEQLLRFSSKKAETRALESLIHCEQLVELLRDTRRRKAPSSRSSELTLIDDEGSEHSFRVTCRSLVTDAHDQDRNAPHGAVAVLNDIGQLKAIQRRNAEFVSAVSHEMKAPLSGIKAYVELLADGEVEDEATREEFLGVISSQAERLQRLVDNLLNLARIEAGVVEVQKQPRSLNELMEEAMNVVTPAAEAKQIVLGTDLSPMYLEVLADRDMLLQAVINLLSNAVKYTPVGGRVTLRTRMEESQAWFEVEDSGVGLSPEDSVKVFEKFYRVKKDSQMAQGTGLGLPLAKHIVEDVHGGSLVVQSELGKGSTFRAILPSAGCMATAK